MNEQWQIAINRMRQRAIELDQEWEQWSKTPEALVEILKNPILANPPSKRMDPVNFKANANPF